MRRPGPNPTTQPASPDRPDRREYVLHGQSAIAPPLPAGLHLVATPIGNLRDITVRALEVLAAADLIACEDTRITGRLLEHYGIRAPLTPYHEHNAGEARPKLIARWRPATPSRWCPMPGHRSCPIRASSSCGRPTSPVIR